MLIVFVSPAMAERKTSWLKATNERIESTIATIHSIKSIKMSGLATAVSNNLQRLRMTEIKMNKYYFILG